MLRNPGPRFTAVEGDTEVVAPIILPSADPIEYTSWNISGEDGGPYVSVFTCSLLYAIVDVVVKIHQDLEAHQPCRGDPMLDCGKSRSQPACTECLSIMMHRCLSFYATGCSQVLPRDARHGSATMELHQAVLECRTRLVAI